MVPLPIDALLPDIVSSLRRAPALVLSAPPGAGKTTRVPRALLDAGFADAGEVVVLEPRRLAARMAATRTADELGEALGQRVGYQVRFQNVSSAKTRIRFVTEGIVAHRFLGSPTLDGTSVVILDEFHERHLQGDVALALLQRLRRSGREGLRVVVMSATLEANALAAYLDAPVLRAEGRRFTVEVEHAALHDERPLALQVASSVRRLVQEDLDGDVLVFLPGAAEIRRAREACEKIAQDADLAVVALHGDLSPEEQDVAVRPASRRKVILSTNVAESSVTIEGVVAVVDSGLSRVASQAPWSGLPRLRVEKVSRASAVQRAGRAGRVRAGRCLRLYTRSDFESRPEHDAPEIVRLDLAQTRLELAALGAGDVPWFEPPPEASLRAADRLLVKLGALGSDGALTPIGRAMLRLSVHPRAARVVVEGAKRGVLQEACAAAALLSEGDPRTAQRAFGSERSDHAPTELSDVLPLVDLVREAQDARMSPGALRAAGLDGVGTRAIVRTTEQLARAWGDRPSSREEAFVGESDAGIRLALLSGYPDRVAKRVRAGGRALALAGGGSAELSDQSIVREAEWLVALDAEERADPASRARAGVVVRMACAIEPEWLLELYAGDVREERTVSFDRATERVVVRETMSWSGLVLHATEAASAFGSGGQSADEVSRALAQAAIAAGPRMFAPEGALDRWLARLEAARAIDPTLAPPDDATICATLERLCKGRSTFAELREANLVGILAGTMGRTEADIARLTPSQVALAGGRSVNVQYEPGKPPAIASRLQDFFGMRDGPAIGGGRLPLVLELLAPNGRPVQRTTDLEGFWRNHYPAIRKELMRKYPRHSWPEDPTQPTPRMRPR